MPCRTDYMDEYDSRSRSIAAEDERRIRSLTAELDTLTFQADMMREDLLRIRDQYPDVELDPRYARTLEADQIKHRKQDLRRLERTFAGVYQHRGRLKKVLAADPTKPLKPQLGFDPDDY